MEEISNPHIRFAKGILLVVAVIAPLLPGEVCRHIGAPGGDADAAVKFDTMGHAGIQDPGGIDSAQTAAYINNSCNHGGFSFLSQFFVPARSVSSAKKDGDGFMIGYVPPERCFSSKFCTASRSRQRSAKKISWVPLHRISCSLA